jgi:phosphopantothenoylcysteine synthetase/decarboxylase
MILKWYNKRVTNSVQQKDHGEVQTIKHISLGDWVHPTPSEDANITGMLVICPATANTIAKLAGGFADNLLTSTYLARHQETRVIIFPAMNTRMWQNQQTQANLKILRKRYFHKVVDPIEGRMACGDTGMGKLAPVRTILEQIIFFQTGKR